MQGIRVSVDTDLDQPILSTMGEEPLAILV
jgi:hypothetical protein